MTGLLLASALLVVAVLALLLCLARLLLLLAQLLVLVHMACSSLVTSCAVKLKRVPPGIH